MEYAAVLENMINRYDITMEADQVASNPVVAADDYVGGVEHYRCRLVRPGKNMNCYVSVESGDGRLNPSDVLLMLILDASGCEMMEGYYGKHEELDFLFAGSDGNLKEFDDFWQEYKGRCHQIRELKAFLGEPLFDELVVQLGFK